MMRNKQNLKKFGHGTKSSHQKQSYNETVYGQQKRGDTTEDKSATSFEETASVEGNRVEGEPIGRGKTNNIPEKFPYRSWKVMIKENLPTTILTALVMILVGLGGWALLAVSDNSESIAVQKSEIGGIKNKVESLEEDLSAVHDRSLRSETMIESLENYINQIIGR